MTPSAVPVSIAGWSASTYGIWGILVTQLFALLFIAIRNGPKWLDSWSTMRAAAAKDEREDGGIREAAALRKEAKEDALEVRVALAEKRMVYLIGALGIVLNALDRENGEHPDVKTALDMLDVAGALGPTDDFSVSLRKMVMNLRPVKGAGESV